MKIDIPKNPHSRSGGGFAIERGKFYGFNEGTTAGIKACKEGVVEWLREMYIEKVKTKRPTHHDAATATVCLKLIKELESDE